MISLTGATYLEPVTEELTIAEKKTLIQYLSSPLPFAHAKKPAYELLCDYWDCFHKSSFFKTGPEGDIFPMPDYIKLKRIKPDKVSKGESI